MGTPTHYEILGVTSTATSDEVRSAYRRLTKATHPDAGGTDAVFVMVNAAYAVLSDPSARASYDRELATPESQRPPAHDPSPSPDQPRRQSRRRPTSEPDDPGPWQANAADPRAGRGDSENAARPGGRENPPHIDGDAPGIDVEGDEEEEHVDWKRVAAHIAMVATIVAVVVAARTSGVVQGLFGEPPNTAAHWLDDNVWSNVGIAFALLAAAAVATVEWFYTPLVSLRNIAHPVVRRGVIGAVVGVAFVGEYVWPISPLAVSVILAAAAVPAAATYAAYRWQPHR